MLINFFFKKIQLMHSISSLQTLRLLDHNIGDEIIDENFIISMDSGFQTS